MYFSCLCHILNLMKHLKMPVFIAGPSDYTIRHMYHPNKGGDVIKGETDNKIYACIKFALVR